MLTLNLKDKDLFGNDAGEDEVPEALNSYYIKSNVHNDFFDENRHLCIVKARKGFGKSALLSQLRHSLLQKNNDAIVIKITGNALLGLGDFKEKEHAYFENYWKVIICKKIIIELGKKIGFALSDNEISMVEAAELENAKSQNLIGALVSRIKGKIPLMPVEYEKKLPKDWENLLSNYTQKKNNLIIWFLVDDIDNSFISNETDKAKISSFFTAIRNLTREYQGIKIRATIRPDVYHEIRTIECMDRVLQYIVEIKWNKDLLRQMLSKRLLSYIKRNHPYSKEASYDYKIDSDKIFRTVFYKRFRFGKNRKLVKPHIPIIILSYNRPRSINQLCRIASSRAILDKSKLIGMKHFNRSMAEFGEIRLQDLLREYRFQFSDLDKLLEIFKGHRNSLYYNALCQFIDQQYIQKVGRDNIPEINGIQFKDPTQLVVFLYKIGFISCTGFHKNHYIHYEDEPDLLRFLTNYNYNKELCIHPTYRQIEHSRFLNKKKRADLHS